MFLEFAWSLHLSDGSVYVAVVLCLLAASCWPCELQVWQLVCQAWQLVQQRLDLMALGQLEYQTLAGVLQLLFCHNLQKLTRIYFKKQVCNGQWLRKKSFSFFNILFIFLLSNNTTGASRLQGTFDVCHTIRNNSQT